MAANANDNVMKIRQSLTTQSTRLLTWFELHLHWVIMHKDTATRSSAPGPEIVLACFHLCD